MKVVRQSNLLRSIDFRLKPGAVGYWGARSRIVGNPVHQDVEPVAQVLQLASVPCQLLCGLIELLSVRVFFELRDRIVNARYSSAPRVMPAYRVRQMLGDVVTAQQLSGLVVRGMT